MTPLRTALAGLMDALPDPVLLLEGGGRIAAANPPARTLFPALAVGQPLTNVLRGPDVLDAVARIARGGEAEAVVWHERVPVERVFDVHVAPAQGAGLPAAVLLTLRDRTAALRLERLRVDFVAHASHELRTPLASLMGFVDTLRGPARDDAAARDRFLAIMHEQAQRMSRLVDDLLSLSRIESHAHLRPKTPIDLAQVVAHVVDTLMPVVRESRATIAFEPPPPLFVAGDRDELVRLVENLVENALKHGAPHDAGADVRIGLDARDGEAVLTVADRGPGIAAAHLPRVTERFYRVDSDPSRRGTGLGLAIVKHIVARHGGQLGLTSTPGAGTSVTVRLPGRA